MSSRIAKLASGIFLASALLAGCWVKNPKYCETPSDCTGGLVCNTAWKECVSPDAAVVPVDSAGGSGGTLSDGAGPTDTGISIDGGIDAPMSDGGADTRVPDAGGTCGVNSDCVDPAKAFCVGNVCVACQLAGASACATPTGVCDSTSGKCVACTADNQCATAAAPICDKTKNACVSCSADLQCQTKSVALPACRADGQCVQCTATTAATACTGATPACDTATNTCVQCTSAATCSGATPICGTSEKCQACAPDTECASLNDPLRAACATTGACVQCTATNATKCTGATNVCNTTTNACVQCLTNATCSGTKPICATATNTCLGCTGASDCSAFAGRTTCAATGACVQCTDNSTCSGSTPICGTATNTCRKCSTDSECSSVGPGVCMVDGHCATDAETVYVQNVAGTCSDTATGAGSVTIPFCSLQKGVGNAKASAKAVVVVTGSLAQGSAIVSPTIPLTIVGKSNGTITPDTGTDGIAITSGTVYLRNLTVQGVTTAGSQTGIGINATSGSTLNMNGCKVTNNVGGMLLNGAAFDIENTTVSNNAAGTFSGIRWGGILVNSLPASGSTIFRQVTVQNNAQVGLECLTAITASTSVLATGNNNGSTDPADQVSGCGFTSCAAASTTCGAQ